MEKSDGVDGDTDSICAKQLRSNWTCPKTGMWTKATNSAVSLLLLSIMQCDSTSKSKHSISDVHINHRDQPVTTEKLSIIL